MEVKFMCMGLNRLKMSVVVEKREKLRGESEKRRV
jgi:hypothetical protein